MKDSFNESHNESTNSHQGANKKRKMDELTTDHQFSQQETDLVETQQKIAKLEETIKNYRKYLLFEFEGEVAKGLRATYFYLEYLQEHDLLDELDFNALIKAYYDGDHDDEEYAMEHGTPLQYCLKYRVKEQEDLRFQNDLLKLLGKHILCPDKIKTLDFKKEGSNGSAFYLLLNEIIEQITFINDAEKNLTQEWLPNSIKINILKNKITYCDLLTSKLELVVASFPLNTLVSTPELTPYNPLNHLLLLAQWSFIDENIGGPYMEMLEKCLNEFPLELNFNKYFMETVANTPWQTHIDFIRKLQDINESLGEQVVSADAQPPMKSFAELFKEAEVLADIAQANGYNSAFCWLSKVLQTQFYHNHPTMEYLDQWRRVAKKIPQNHPEYNEIHRALVDEYRMFLTEREKVLSDIPRVERSTDQQAEFEALQRPKLLTALRAAGRIKDNDPVGKELYYRLGYMLVQGIDQVEVTQNLEFEAMLDKLSSSSKKECVLFLCPSLALENSNAAMSTEKATGEQEVSESSTQLGFGFSSSKK